MGYLLFILTFILIIEDIKFIVNLIKYHKDDIKAIIRKVIIFFKDWCNAISVIIAWLITNGWGWIFMFLGRFLSINWMKYIGNAYVAFLWLPWVNEKVVTIALALLIRKILFGKKIKKQEQLVQENINNEVN